MSKDAEDAGIDGTLVVAVTVDKTGSVKWAAVIAGPAWPCGVTEPKKALEEVRRGVREAVLKTKFTPAYKNGKPVSSDIHIDFAVGEVYQNKLHEEERKEALKNGKRRPSLIQAGMLNGKAIGLQRPDYPASAMPSRITGTVSVQVLIDENGKVIRAGVLSGHPLLVENARNAACMARFSPTNVQGQPARVTGVITYNFSPDTR